RREPVDLVRLVRDTVEDQRSAMEENHLQLAVELPDTPVLVNGDPIRLTQVLVNLLNNAVKFTDPTGRVSVSLSVETDAELNTKTQRHEERHTKNDLAGKEGELFQASSSAASPQLPSLSP